MLFTPQVELRFQPAHLPISLHLPPAQLYPRKYPTPYPKKHPKFSIRSAAGNRRARFTVVHEATSRPPRSPSTRSPRLDRHAPDRTASIRAPCHPSYVRAAGDYGSRTTSSTTHMVGTQGPSTTTARRRHLGGSSHTSQSRSRQWSTQSTSPDLHPELVMEASTARQVGASTCKNAPAAL